LKNDLINLAKSEQNNSNNPVIVNIDIDHDLAQISTKSECDTTATLNMDDNNKINGINTS